MNDIKRDQNSEVTEIDADVVNNIFDISDEAEFNNLALKIFRFQYNNNAIYNSYASSVLDNHPEKVTKITDIPFLPIKYFKTKRVASFDGDPQAIFTSSSTTGMTPAKHFVKDLKIYEKSFIKGFEIFYGDIADYDILALLPSYLEREGSSLIYMAKTLIDRSIQSTQNAEYSETAICSHVEDDSRLRNKKRINRSGFYLYNYSDLYKTLNELQIEGRKVILLGVTFALLDFCKEYKLSFPELIIMETGGMKGRGKEITRDELHKTLYNGFGTTKIHSEYGMAELLSQAYLVGNMNDKHMLDKVFFTPPWMKVLIRNLHNPFSYTGELGGINIIDLANIWSCSFIETEDIGRIVNLNRPNDTAFTVEGRLKNSERRGCNMLIE